ncbi:aldo/keto reductase [Corynebacterium sp.]|uniref:aldo/keto reductase n=1 Tax=Corynebacterium sp. TaxID=1720 RepID=UPI0026DB4E87|nr:aldo/keto reductase [Corynebacterium sp.]MDO5076282.1 aldo/keto reductase [Corynebacterium sp.]
MGAMNIPSVTLNDGTEMPQLGFGTYKLEEEQAYTSVRRAIEVGYRHIDTAAIYGNEEEVGRAVRDAVAAGDTTRDELFITTKLWNNQQHEPGVAFQQSLRRLGLDYIDLYLVHWPCPKQDQFVAAFEGVARIQGLGTVQSIGVCNFYPEVLHRIITETGVVPAVNQIELHPGFPQVELRELHQELGVVTQSWSPLGQGQLVTEPRIVEIAATHQRTPAQVILRWHLQLGLVPLPKSATDARILENLQVFDFHLGEDEMAALNALDSGRIGPDPLEFPA